MEDYGHRFNPAGPPRISWWDVLVKSWKLKKPKFNGEIGKVKIIYDDIFHIKNLYKMVYEFLEEKGFEALNGGGKWVEDYYLEKHTGGVLEYWFYWNVQKKINPYYRHVIKISYHCLALSKVEIEYQGKKMKMNKGEVTIEIEAEVETDYNKEWRNHWFLKHFREGYDRIIYDRELRTMEWMNLYRLVYELQGQIKAYLNVRTMGPIPAALHPVAEGIEGRWPKV